MNARATLVNRLKFNRVAVATLQQYTREVLSFEAAKESRPLEFKPLWRMLNMLTALVEVEAAERGKLVELLLV